MRQGNAHSQGPGADFQETGPAGGAGRFARHDQALCSRHENKNATQAAIRVGYSKKTATEQASRLLTNVKVSEAIAKRMQALAAKTGVTAEKVIAELALVGFANMGDYLDLSDPEHPKIDISNLTPEQTAAIAEVTYDKRGIERRVKIKLHDKLNALVNLGKHLGLFSERHLLGGLDGGEIRHTQHMEVELVNGNV